MHYDMEKSGERIRQLRIKSGYTQEKIAGLLNVDRSFYSRIEAGKSGCTVDLFVLLSELFNVSLDYLILGRYNKDLVKDVERSLLRGLIEDLIDHLERVKEIFC